jgi:hypothetical protein
VHVPLHQVFITNFLFANERKVTYTILDILHIAKCLSHVQKSFVPLCQWLPSSSDLPAAGRSSQLTLCSLAIHPRGCKGGRPDIQSLCQPVKRKSFRAFVIDQFGSSLNDNCFGQAGSCCHCLSWRISGKD